MSHSNAAMTSIAPANNPKPAHSSRRSGIIATAGERLGP